jgi:hypothetical protein
MIIISVLPRYYARAPHVNGTGSMVSHSLQSRAGFKLLDLARLLLLLLLGFGVLRTRAASPWSRRRGCSMRTLLVFLTPCPDDLERQYTLITANSSLIIPLSHSTASLHSILLFSFNLRTPRSTWISAHLLGRKISLACNHGNECTLHVRPTRKFTLWWRFNLLTCPVAGQWSTGPPPVHVQSHATGA